MNGSFSSLAGGIVISDGVLVVSAPVTSTALRQAITRTGGTVVVSGTLDNTGQTLRLGATTGSWNLTGTLKGGTLELADGATLNVQNGTFDGVTLASDLIVDNTTLTLTNGLTLANRAKLTLGTAQSSSQMFYSGTQTLGGTGSLVFANSSVGYIWASGPGALTLDTGITVLIQGYAQLYGYDDANRLINKGRIVVDASGQASLINLDNQGTVEVIDGTLTIQTVTVATNSSIRAMGGSLWFDGSYTRASIEATVSLLGGRVTYL